MIEHAAPGHAFIAGKRTAVLLHWASTDPMMVTLVFPDHQGLDGRPNRWDFSFPALVDGCRRFTKEGDVIVWPTTSYIMIGLNGVDHDGRNWYVEVPLPWLLVRDFLTVVAVDRHRAVEAGFAQMLAGA